jgi:hypothetical protein
MAAMKKAGPAPSTKVTQADINRHVEKERKAREGRGISKVKVI